MRGLPVGKNLPKVRHNMLSEFKSAFYYLYKELFQEDGFSVQPSTGRIVINWRSEKARRRILGYVSFIVRKVQRETEYWTDRDCKKMRDYITLLDIDLGRGQADLLLQAPRETHYHRAIEKINLTFEMALRLIDKGIRRAQIPYGKRGKGDFTNARGWGRDDYGYPY